MFLVSVTVAALSLSAVSCRDLSVDNGKSALTCAASSISTATGAELKLMDPNFGGNELAQSFKPQSTIKNVKSVSLGLKRVTTGVAALSGKLSVMIVSDKNGVPDLTNSLGTIATLDVSKVTTASSAVTFPFGNPLSELTANTTYWIVLNGNFSWNQSAYIAWLGTDTDSYSDGQALAYNGLGWLNPDSGSTSSTNRRDLSFQIGCL